MQGGVRTLKLSVGGQCCCGLGTEVCWVSAEDLSTVLPGCVALSGHLGLMLASTRSINFHHTQNPETHCTCNMCVGSLITKVITVLGRLTILNNLFLPEIDRCTLKKLF